MIAALAMYPFEELAEQYDALWVYLRQNAVMGSGSA